MLTVLIILLIIILVVPSLYGLIYAANKDAKKQRDGRVRKRWLDSGGDPYYDPVTDRYDWMSKPSQDNMSYDSDCGD